jgi:hypothetical protein
VNCLKRCVDSLSNGIPAETYARPRIKSAGSQSAEQEVDEFALHRIARLEGLLHGLAERLGCGIGDVIEGFAGVAAVVIGGRYDIEQLL